MATITGVQTNPQRRVMRVTWTGLAGATTDDGFPASIARYADKTVHIIGTSGTMSVEIQGSNDNQNWSPLKEPDGTPITGKSTNEVLSILQNPSYIRPVNSGAGSTATVILEGVRNV